MPRGRGGHGGRTRSDEASVGAVVGLMYERYAARVYGFCVRRLGDRDEGADATQDTFLRAWLALRNGAEVRHPLPWLLTIADNVCVSRFRARGARVETTALSDGVTRDFSETVGEAAGLAAALRALPARQRQALLRREVQGYSYDEIGEELGVSNASVAALLHRARLAVADALREARRGAAALVPVPAFLRAPFESGAAATMAVAGTAVVAATQLAGGGAIAPSPEPAARSGEAVSVVAGPARYVNARRPAGTSAGAASQSPSYRPYAARGARPPAGRPPATGEGAVGVLGASARVALDERTSAHVSQLRPDEGAAAESPGADLSSPTDSGTTPAASEPAAGPAAGDERAAAPEQAPQAPTHPAKTPPGKQPRGERGRSQHAPGHSDKAEQKPDKALDEPAPGRSDAEKKAEKAEKKGDDPSATPAPSPEAPAPGNADDEDEDQGGKGEGGGNGNGKPPDPDPDKGKSEDKPKGDPPGPKKP